MHMSGKNEIFNKMLLSLKNDLIDEKKEYDPLLKDYFLKILEFDYLPFLHINRY
jgi:hypothetical protein